MNYARLIKTIAELSAKSEKNLNKNTLGFSHLPEKLQQQVVDSTAKGLGRNPFDTEIDKRLLDSIKVRLNNPNFRNKLKSSKFDNYSLDDEATKFLEANADKISKDLEDYTTVPLDYKDKANRVDLSKFVDEDDGTEMSQNEAISHLLYSENEPSTYKGGLDEFTEDLNKTLDSNSFANKYYPEIDTDAVGRAMSRYEYNPQMSKDELDFLNNLLYDRRINRFKSESRKPFDVFVSLKEGLQNRSNNRFNKLVADLFEQEILKNYPDIEFKSKGSAWKKLQKDEEYPITSYIRTQKYPVISKKGNQYYPLDDLQQTIKDKYVTRNPTKQQASMDKYLYDTTKDEQRLVNEDLLPKDAIDTDSITGNSIDEIYKYADIDNYERTNKGFNYYDKDELDALYNKETFGDEGYEQWWDNTLDNTDIDKIIQGSYTPEQKIRFNRINRRYLNSFKQKPK